MGLVCVCVCVKMISLQIAWQPNTVVPGDWGLGYKKHFNENLFDLAQKELHGRESPSPGFVIRMPNNRLGTASVWKNSTAKLLFGHILHSPCCGFWSSVGVINASFCFSRIRKQVNYWPVTLKLVILIVSDVGQVLKDSMPLFWFFFFFSTALSWTWSC